MNEKNQTILFKDENTVDVSKSTETVAIKLGRNGDEIKSDSTEIISSATVSKSETQAEKDAKFLEAHKAFAQLMKLRKKKHRGKNAGAFGGVGTLRKKKKKLARYLERNTVL